MYLHILVPFAFAYFIAYLLRVVNAVAGPALAVELSLTPADLGLMTSAFLLAFGGAQLPLGVALDRYGARLVECVLLVFAAIGALVFAFAPASLPVLIGGRALIGLGVSACLMGALTALTQAVPRQSMPLVSGLLLAAGGLGALFGGAPSALVLASIGWRGLFALLAGLVLLAAFLLFLFGPRAKVSRGESLAAQIAGTRMVFRDPLFRRLAPIAIASQASMIALFSLWTGPWLGEVAGYSPERAGVMLSFLALGLICGFLVTGIAASRLAAVGISVKTTALAGMASTGLLLLVLALLPAALTAAWIWPLLAFLSTTATLAFTVFLTSFAPEYSGRVSTAQNFLVFVLGFALQWGFGLIVERMLPLVGVKGAYDTAIAGLVALQAVAALWYVFAPTMLARR